MRVSCLGHSFNICGGGKCDRVGCGQFCGVGQSSKILDTRGSVGGHALFVGGTGGKDKRGFVPADFAGHGVGEKFRKAPRPRKNSGFQSCRSPLNFGKRRSVIQTDEQFRGGGRVIGSCHTYGDGITRQSIKSALGGGKVIGGGVGDGISGGGVLANGGVNGGKGGKACGVKCRLCRVSLNAESG